MLYEVITYCVGEGAAYISAHQGVAIAMPDTPLIQLGSLNHQFRLLNGDAKLQQDPAHLYAWPMNNYWETNFAATLGGFYEFRYLVAWGEQYQTPEAAMDACRSMNAGILAWRVHYVITSYSIHYTKLYEHTKGVRAPRIPSLLSAIR